MVDIHCSSCLYGEDDYSNDRNWSVYWEIISRLLRISLLMSVQFFFSLYPVIVKRFANQGETTANAYVFTFYRWAALLTSIFYAYIMNTGNNREIGALLVLFMSAKFFEGTVQVPDIRTMIVSFVCIKSNVEVLLYVINSSCLEY